MYYAYGTDAHTKIGNYQAHVIGYNFLLGEKSKNFVSLSSSMAHITLMCDKGTIYSILPVTAECQTKPWERPAESVCKAKAGGKSLRKCVSRFHSWGKGGYISLGNELNFLVTRSEASK